jgi:hypothetical protein
MYYFLDEDKEEVSLENNDPEEDDIEDKNKQIKGLKELLDYKSLFKSRVHIIFY